MKPTPVPLEAISSKRPRTGQRASALKRKVLMDESMVLLGEYGSFLLHFLFFVDII